MIFSGIRKTIVLAPCLMACVAVLSGCATIPIGNDVSARGSSRTMTAAEPVHVISARPAGSLSAGPESRMSVGITIVGSR